MALTYPVIIDHAKTANQVALLVEDERVARQALSVLLRSAGFEIRAVESAEDALALVAETGTPDLAIVDFNLPGMNGFELIQRLELLNPHIFPVLISAAAHECLEPVLRGRDLVCLRKPFQFERLLSILKQDRQRH